MDLGDLSDDEFFDMGQYNLDRDLMINPNNKLHNLFGGASASPKKRKLSGESGASHRHGKDEYNFSSPSLARRKRARRGRGKMWRRTSAQSLRCTALIQR